MSLDPLSFPLHGSRLIEASAGTGKTWTIAALYVRLVLGHGEENAFSAPLAPSDILVMTFTRAATRELSDRIRARLIEAAACLRAPVAHGDPFLTGLWQSYADTQLRSGAAHRLSLAANAMDDAAIFTIDSWCQRMLREHAFDSGNLFDETLAPDDAALFDDAVRDYWRQYVYPLGGADFDAFSNCVDSVMTLAQHVKQMLAVDRPWPVPATRLPAAFAPAFAARAALKSGWVQHAQDLEAWLLEQVQAGPGQTLSGTLLKKTWIKSWTAALSAWASNPAAETSTVSDSAWKRLSPAGIAEAQFRDRPVPQHPLIDALPKLREAYNALPPLTEVILEHAAAVVRERLRTLKQQAASFGFADMLERLDAALGGENAARLRKRIVDRYPFALIDEFQDTAPVQFRIFDHLYRIADNAAQTGVVLIGDPKQSIYGFRGADIHSYLLARKATHGRHYDLDTNFRSTQAVVDAVNHVFGHAEGLNGTPPFPGAAFLFNGPQGNPVPFVKVGAKGRDQTFVTQAGDHAPLTVWHTDEPLNGGAYRTRYAEACAQRIVELLSDAKAGFAADGVLQDRLRPADIAVLVQSGKQAGAVRDALRRRQVASVYLSERDSVLCSQEALDVWRWLKAVANPLDGRAARAAWAAPSFGESLETLADLATDDYAWDARVDILRTLNVTWARQGVLAMLRRALHDLDLPARLLARGHSDGERVMTNLLHIGDLLQAASQEIAGQHALVRWLSDQIDDAEAALDAPDHQKVRLESDADLVKIVTIHKSKGLEYPLVFVPFASSCRTVNRKGKAFFSWAGEDGVRRFDYRLDNQTLERADEQRRQEDVRLLYVALTRARFAVWLGAANVLERSKSLLPKTALGYLLNAGESIEPAELPARLESVFKGGGIDCVGLEATTARTMLSRSQSGVALAEPLHFTASFDRAWGVSSFSAVKRSVAAVAPGENRSDERRRRRDAESAADDSGDLAAATAASAVLQPWHELPAGADIGDFIHEQLDWLSAKGFAFVETDEFARMVAERCKRHRWHDQANAVLTWLRAIVAASFALTPGAKPFSLASLPPPDNPSNAYFSEMEFWMPSQNASLVDIDAICRRWIELDAPRGTLPDQALRGMFKGYIDLVFKHDGRYWLLDYKTSIVERTDSAYTRAALEKITAKHRYDLQGVLYLVALHRLLRVRLGASYEPARDLGGAAFFYLRGIGAGAQCCVTIPTDAVQLNALDLALTNLGVAA
ncbi:exodeoxyribonuclease V subunit beta [Paraburkholderia sediminicola]|uniref:exodeoxyribonuclease V subunit beta n=1 Tax=Paraburkholderia sediminicola TaxID=458836 RepID=UPI0038B94F32